MKTEPSCISLKALLGSLPVWVERRVSQEIYLHISPEGSIQCHRKTIMKDDEQLQKEGAPMNEAVLWEEIA